MLLGTKSTFITFNFFFFLISHIYRFKKNIIWWLKKKKKEKRKRKRKRKEKLEKCRLTVTVVSAKPFKVMEMGTWGSPPPFGQLSKTLHSADSARTHTRPKRKTIIIPHTHTLSPPHFSPREMIYWEKGKSKVQYWGKKFAESNLKCWESILLLLTEAPKYTFL